MAKADKFSMSVVKKLEKAITESGLSKSEVIRRASISQDYFYSRTRGDKPFTTNDISRIAKVIGVDPILLLRAAAKASESQRIITDPSTLSEEEAERLALSDQYGKAANDNPEKELESGLDGQ